MKVFIPFMLEFRDALLSDRKIWTSRNKRYGKQGDTFEIFEHEFEIQRTFKACLEEVADSWMDEGCNSREELIEVWKKLHPRKGFVPEQEVWVHVFKRIGKKET